MCIVVVAADVVAKVCAAPFCPLMLFIAAKADAGAMSNENKESTVTSDFIMQFFDPRNCLHSSTQINLPVKSCAQCSIAKLS
jgi:hypothetical protein